MKFWQLHKTPIIGIVLFLVGWKFMYPWLGYMLDSDAVGYLTVAERVQRGEYFTSINALWSPLNSWLLLVYGHPQMNLFFRAQLWNVFFGAILLLQTWGLMGVLRVQTMLRMAYQITISLVMIFLVYYQVFADLLQCVFVMTYLWWLVHQQNKQTLLTPLVAGLIMGLGFYAKSYTWFFFLLHFLSLHMLLVYKKQYSIKRAIQHVGVGIFISLLIMLPWIYLIHAKFNVWSVTGLSGKLNMSWYINSGKTFKDSIGLLIPPTYADSPSFWEDPFPSQGVLTGPFSSMAAFIHWVARVIHTSFTAIYCYAELSVFALLMLLWGVYSTIWHKRKSMNGQADEVIVLALMVLPIGYLTMHVETRYLWLTLFLIPIVFDRYLKQTSFAFKWVLIAGWAISFLVFPALQIEALRGKNKDLFQESTRWKQQQFVNKSFTSSASDDGRMWVLSYLTKSRYYTIEASDYSEQDLIAEMKRYHIQWYLQEKQKCNDGLHFEGNEQWKKQMETDRFVFYELMP